MGKLEITKNDLKKRFAEYNDLYFQNKLKMPLFKFIMAKKPYGSCHVDKKRCEIWISKYVKWTDETLKNVLIHEMIHQYVYEVLHGCKYTLFPHGIRFYYVRWRLNNKYDLGIDKIPI
ncbi:SprT-like domain-containing protein [Bacteroides gallinaceum]|jgi:predicted SprT family Zn-dependent metalloprotease|uniref:SprT-like domain-containing protein n=2 Tax=Bacteroides gallinaceum TaxID=1462571 RepID=A0ABT7X5X3_9BACE|nr:SprT-like domain-containing protein [Bacteroides gallinaceum]MDN0049462.1 SprT-like domain-containing protein [Bacteroides gallinaceum]